MNGIIIQFFHWYHPGNLWNEFIEKSDYLKSLGFTAVWLPPAYKCDLGKEGRGYDVYDLYDLGEFDQKGGIPTRYGTKEEYLNAIKKAQESGMSVYADIVLNHRMGGDEAEEITIHRVNEEDRNQVLGDPFTANAFTKFTFPGRNGTYSQFIWDYQCFSGIDAIQKDGEEIKGVFKIHNEYGTEWNDAVSHQFGNYDYLMGADVEYRNPYVVEELKNWIKWYLDTTKVNGIRLDALKHIPSDFLKDWVSYIKTEIAPNCFILGEFWKDEADKISDFFDRMDNLLSCFDAPLHYNFFTASKEGKDYDLTKILENTFLKENPLFSVSFVENHDTQKFQALESSVADWFKPMAYAIILLSKEAYPCVFYPDLFGAEYTEMKDDQEVNVIIPKLEVLSALLQVRQQFAYGEQIDYFDHPNCIAWVRTGDSEHPGCVVVISNSDEGYKEIELGAEHAHAQYTDFLQQRNDTVTLDENGKGTFRVNVKSVSVWIKNQ
ncbi:alpha-amylase [Chryseobacterium daecheongense]|uniref:Alpha-amylase n=1 Tax=Chryseobacterium daecheongense TaxID=192389 RepID=A0A3N0W412_9FLAO|nr:alpha-amylase [Chryseobacterium daecheongense]ROH99752.1 alpha-amylase [Chryseobacterium daecheongense]TDX95322.1 alpha-amylase [Chryseobacterium daecheongense]